jgi:hypothetical protein
MVLVCIHAAIETELQFRFAEHTSYIPPLYSEAGEA